MISGNRRDPELARQLFSHAALRVADGDDLAARITQIARDMGQLCPCARTQDADTDFIRRGDGHGEEQKTRGREDEKTRRRVPGRSVFLSGCTGIAVLASVFALAAPRLFAQAGNTAEVALNRALELEGANKCREALPLYRQAVQVPDPTGAVLGPRWPLAARWVWLASRRPTSACCSCIWSGCGRGAPDWCRATGDWSRP